jgi:hypothetical protein
MVSRTAVKPLCPCRNLAQFDWQRALVPFSRLVYQPKQLVEFVDHLHVPTVASKIQRIVTGRAENKLKTPDMFVVELAVSVFRQLCQEDCHAAL